MNNRNEKKRRPSCLGCILLMLAIVLGLKYVYRRYPKEEIAASDTEAESHAEGTDSTVGQKLDSLIGKLHEAVESVGKRAARTESSFEKEQEPQRIPLYDALYDGLKDGAPSVAFDYDCSDVLFDTFRQVCDGHPELFWLDGGGNLQISTYGVQTKVEFTPGRTMEPERIPEAIGKLEQAAAEILAGIPEAASDYETILYIHDRLVTDTDYDQDAADRFAGSNGSLGTSANAYGCLVEHRAVCSGYAATFRLLMNRAGIPCRNVSGFDSLSGMPHAWNCVQAGGDWYYIDVTWDDPTYEESGISRGISRECFLITTEELLLTHTIADGQEVPECTAVRENYFVRNGMTLPAYTFEAAAELIRNQMGNDGVFLKFPDTEEAEKACADLFDGQRFYEIVPEAGSVRYSMGMTGLLSLWIE